MASQSADTPTVNEPLSVSFPYRPEQHADAVLEAPLNRLTRVLSRALVAMSVVFMAMIAAAGAAEGRPTRSFLEDAGGWLGLATFWWFAPGMLGRFTRWSFRRKRAAGGMELRVFSEEGFLGSSDWAQPVPWFLVDRVVETPNFFLVYSTSAEPSWIPKAELKPGDLERLHDLFRQHSTRVSKGVLDRSALGVVNPFVNR